jgi:hypothetical protein
MPEISVNVTEEQYESIRELAVSNGVSIAQYAGNLLDKSFHRERKEAKRDSNFQEGDLYEVSISMAYENAEGPEEAAELHLDQIRRSDVDHFVEVRDVATGETTTVDAAELTD